MDSNQIQEGNFVSTILLSTDIILIKDKDNNQLELTPAEASTFIELIGWTKTLLASSMLPPYIESGLFRANFNEEGEVRLTRLDRGGNLPYTASDIVSLIVLVKKTLEKAKDWKAFGRKKIFRASGGGGEPPA